MIQQIGSFSGGFVVMVDHQPSRAVQKRVAEREAAGLCLLCDSPVYSRGCCSKHYQRFRTELKDQPVEERPAFEAKAIREGMILEDRQGRRPNVKNEFRQLTKG